MKQDNSFQQRWEFRNANVSSDDEGSDPTDNAAADLVLYENDDPEIHNSKAAAEADEKKKTKTKTKKSSKKKRRKDSMNEEAMFRDLKIFAESLIHELAAARKSMFADMRDEMGKLVASTPNKGLAKKNIAAANEPQKFNMNSLKSDQLRLPTTVSSSQLQNQRNSIHFIKDHIQSMDFNLGRLMGAKSFGGFALNYHKNWGLYGESRSHIGRGVGLPGAVPVDQGTNDCFYRSSMSFMGGVGLTTGGGGGASLRVISNGIGSSVVRRTEGEFASSQFQKDFRSNPTNKNQRM